MKNYHDSYRPDIDGLRAFAIISVVLFHAFPESIKGGFVGVDVFFVISGYLISSIIFKSLEAGSFSYVDFYIRRIKRIFPALSVVLMSCMLIGWLVLLPDEYAQLGKHVLSGVGFISNLVLWRESGYFDTSAELKPLLHLWSLGVEEQYYIVWPILVALIWKREHNFLLLVVPVLALSFALNLLWVHERPTAAFFLPMSRFWELMIGSLLAFLVLRKHYWLELICGRVHGDWFAASGFCLLLLSVLIIDKDSAFPGWWALMPTLGTFLLIYAGRGAWINAHILGNKCVVYVGLISYPLYLWHWPVLVLGRLAGINEIVFGKLALVILAVVLAMMTFHWIETPIRKTSRSPASVAVLLSVAMLFVAAFGAALMFMVKPMNSSKEIQQIVSAAGEWDYPGRLKIFDSNGSPLRQQGNSEGQTILFIGDSNIEQYYPRAEYQLEKNPKSMNIVFATSGGCPPISSVFERKHPNCLGFVDSATAYANGDNVKTIVVGAQWFGYLTGVGNYYFEDENGAFPLKMGSEGYLLAMSSLQEMLTKFVKHGKQVFLIGSIPIGRENDPKGMIKRSITNKQFVSVSRNAISKDAFMSTYKSIQEDLSKVAIASGAVLISPTDYLCDEAICATVTPSGDPIYKDASHLRPSYVRKEVHFIDDVFH
jgi:peptidoglycan/LPS O-acetylase OafA/YrhL